MLWLVLAVVQIGINFSIVKFKMMFYTIIINQIELELDNKIEFLSIDYQSIN